MTGSRAVVVIAAAAGATAATGLLFASYIIGAGHAASTGSIIFILWCVAAFVDVVVLFLAVPAAVRHTRATRAAAAARRAARTENPIPVTVGGQR